MQKSMTTLPIEQIKPYENNPRLNDDAVEAVRKSMEQCGYIAPIVVDENHVVLAGHTRLKALKEMGAKECDVLEVTGLSDDEKRKYRLLDNKTNELALWDFDKLAEELEGLDFDDLELDWGVDLDGDLVFDEPPEEDDFDEDDADEHGVQVGQVWKLGRHFLMCGDGTNAQQVLKLTGGACIDMLLTDPPYGVSYTGKTKDKLTIENDSITGEQFQKFLECAFLSAQEVMSDGAAFYIWCASSTIDDFMIALKRTKLVPKQQLIWVKNQIVLGRQDFQWKHEPCIYGWKAGAPHNWYADRKQSTVLEFNKPMRNGEHPTMKPVELFDYQMKCSTKHGDNVLDLFGGSGTTIIASEQNGRNAYVMELDPHYCDVIISRWENYTGEKAVLIAG